MNAQEIAKAIAIAIVITIAIAITIAIHEVGYACRYTASARTSEQ